MSQRENPVANGVMKSDFNADGHKIVNLNTPTLDDDAATKKYVDDNAGFSPTDSQLNAMNSGVTAAKVAAYDGYAAAIAGKYTKPSTGIPAADLASSVQTSLGKADSALQPADLDDAVTRTSANGVKSSGIWSSIWGALTALPAGFTSLYDWCVDQLAGKLSTSGGTVTGDISMENGLLDAGDVKTRSYFDFSKPGENPKYLDAPENSGKALTDADLQESSSTLGAALGGKLNKSGGTMQGDLNINGRDINITSAGRVIVRGLNGYVAVFANDGIDFSTDDAMSWTHFDWPSASGNIALTAGTGHNGNLAALDANGNPVDSGKSAADFATAASLTAHTGDTTIHVTAADKAAWNAKQDALSQAQLDAVNSGITAAKVSAYDGYAATIAGKADAADLRYALTTKTISNGAVSLDDRAINAVAVSSSLASLTVNFPAATSGKSRDFGVRLTVASGITTAPQLVLPQGVTCENADGTAPEIGADGAATILYFTETAAGVFLVKGEVVQTIS